MGILIGMGMGIRVLIVFFDAAAATAGSPSC